MHVTVRPVVYIKGLPFCLVVPDWVTGFPNDIYRKFANVPYQKRIPVTYNCYPPENSIYM